MTRLQKVFWLAFTGVLLLGGYAFFLTFHYVEKEVSMPPRGEARYNPLYVLAESLRAMGHDVDTRAYLNWDAMQPGPRDVLLLASPLSSLSYEQIWQVQEWVYDGGYLLFSAPATRSENESELLGEIGLSVGRGDIQCLGWTHLAEAEPTRFCSNLSLTYPHDDLIWAMAYQGRDLATLEELSELFDEVVEQDDVESDETWREADSQDSPSADDEVPGLFAVKAALGEGEWVALASMNPIVRMALEHPANSALAWQLLAPWLGDNKIHIVYAVEMQSAHVLLVRYGWPVMLPLLLALLAWLWARSQSFGPPVPLPQTDRRALLEHIDAAGQFAFREQLVEPLYTECRRRFDLQLQKEHPSLAALPLDEKIRALAARWQLESSAVEQALNPQHLGRADPFVLAIRTLTQMQGLS